MIALFITSFITGMGLTDPKLPVVISRYYFRDNLYDSILEFRCLTVTITNFNLILGTNCTTEDGPLANMNHMMHQLLYGC